MVEQGIAPVVGDRSGEPQIHTAPLPSKRTSIGEKIITVRNFTLGGCNPLTTHNFQGEHFSWDLIFSSDSTAITDKLVRLIDSTTEPAFI